MRRIGQEDISENYGDNSGKFPKLGLGSSILILTDKLSIESTGLVVIYFFPSHISSFLQPLYSR